MRFACLLLAAAVAAPAAAGQAPYYGPIKTAGISLDNGIGVTDRVRRDGRWQVSAVSKGAHALDLALYRAAEMAQAAGYPYVQLLRGYEARNWMRDLATVEARPSDSPAPPPDCWKRRRNSCYTADAAEVMRRLGGVDGRTPGVPIADHLDARGREAALRGYGVGMVSGAPLGAATPPDAAVAAPAPMPARAIGRVDPLAADGGEQAAADRYDAALRAARPGWTAAP